MAYLVKIQVPLHREGYGWAIFGGSLHEDWEALDLPPGKYIVYGPPSNKKGEPKLTDDGVPAVYEVVACPVIEEAPQPKRKIKLVKSHARGDA